MKNEVDFIPDQRKDWKICEKCLHKDKCPVDWFCKTYLRVTEHYWDFPDDKL